MAEAAPKISDPKAPEASLDSRKRGGTKQKSSTTTTSSSSTKPQKENEDVVLNILKNIQSVQLQTKSEFESLVKRMDSMENAMNEPYCEDFEGYGPEDYYSESQSDIGDDFSSASVKCDKPGTSGSSAEPRGYDRFSGLSKRFKSVEICGENIDETLAGHVTDLFRKGMDEAQYEQMVKDENIPRPENCEGLQLVRMNRIIWDIMSRQAQTADAKLQKCAMSVIKASVILAKAVDKLVKSEKSLKDSDKSAPGTVDFDSVIESFNDAIALLGHANYQNSMVRLDLVKPELKKEFSFLCNHNIPYTGWLFGDDVSKTVKEIEDSSKMGHKVHQGGFNYRKGPMRGRGGFRGTYRYRPYGAFMRGRGFGATRAPLSQADEGKNSRRLGVRMAKR